MKIGIVAYQLSNKKITGVERYIRSLISALNKIDNKNHYIIYGWSKPFDFPLLNDNFHFITEPYKAFWNQRILPKLIAKTPVDCLFFPGSIIPKTINPKIKIVFHFHDLGFKFYPEAFSLKERYLNDLSIKRAKVYADRIIVSSNSSKNDLIKFYNFPTKKINVIPFGFDKLSKYNDVISKKRQGILYVGRIEAKKNILNLLSAYKLYVASAKIPEELNLVGMAGNKSPEIIKQIKQLQDQGLPLNWHGYLTDVEVSKLYQRSKIFLFPSLYEGFGLPILEAFAAGLAVITSNSSSMPEVAANGAVLINPNNPKEIAEAIIKLSNDDDFRQNLVSRGRERLKVFSWDKCAKETLDVFEKIN